MYAGIKVAAGAIGQTAGATEGEEKTDSEKRDSHGGTVAVRSGTCMLCGRHDERASPRFLSLRPLGLPRFRLRWRTA
jgi:hypothetical protein